MQLELEQGKLTSKVMQIRLGLLSVLGITHNGTVAISDTERGRTYLASFR